MSRLKYHIFTAIPVLCGMLCMGVSLWCMRFWVEPPRAHQHQLSPPWWWAYGVDQDIPQIVKVGVAIKRKDGTYYLRGWCFDGAFSMYAQDRKGGMYIGDIPVDRLVEISKKYQGTE